MVVHVGRTPEDNGKPPGCLGLGQPISGLRLLGNAPYLRMRSHVCGATAWAEGVVALCGRPLL